MSDAVAVLQSPELLMRAAVRNGQVRFYGCFSALPDSALWNDAVVERSMRIHPTILNSQFVCVCF